MSETPKSPPEPTPESPDSALSEDEFYKILKETAQPPKDAPPTPEVVMPAREPVSPPKPTKAPVTFTDRLRKISHAVLYPMGAGLHKLGIHPNHLTITGTVLVVISAVLIGFGALRAAFVMLLLALPFDALDGAVARAGGTASKFGAVLDSTLDRYADAAIFAGLGYHSARSGQPELLMLAFAALIGSFAVSYVRARAEGVGVDVKIGLFSRVERLLIILVMLFAPELIPAGLILLAVGTNFTAIQRIVYVYRVLQPQQSEG